MLKPGQKVIGTDPFTRHSFHMVVDEKGIPRLNPKPVCPHPDHSKKG